MVGNASFSFSPCWGGPLPSSPKNAALRKWGFTLLAKKSAWHFPTWPILYLGGGVGRERSVIGIPPLDRVRIPLQIKP